MKKKSIFLEVILCVTLAFMFAACNKTHSCECLVSGYGTTQTISMGEYEGNCRDISIFEIANHVGGYIDNPYNYDWRCYEK